MKLKLNLQEVDEMIEGFEARINGQQHLLWIYTSSSVYGGLTDNLRKRVESAKAGKLRMKLYKLTLLKQMYDQLSIEILKD